MEMKMVLGLCTCKPQSIHCMACKVHNKSIKHRFVIYNYKPMFVDLLCTWLAIPTGTFPVLSECLYSGVRSRILSWKCATVRFLLQLTANVLAQL